MDARVEITVDYCPLVVNSDSFICHVAEQEIASERPDFNRIAIRRDNIFQSVNFPVCRNFVEPLYARSFQLHRRIETDSDCAVNRFYAESIEGFKLAAFGGHRRVNCRATRIQVGRDALLLGQRRERHLDRSKVALAQALPRSSGGARKDLVLPPRSREAVGQELVIKSCRWTNDTNVLVDIPLAKVVRHERATPD